ncbi:MAG: hypothetical protein QOI26_235, partial [Pseudonocardiales bacterium]|nr:hypothetical protein [Pseudonocardiales bacterium]
DLAVIGCVYDIGTGKLTIAVGD